MNKKGESKNKKSEVRSGLIKNFFEIPREVISKEPKLTIMGFNEMLVENYKGILEYEDFYIRINTEIGIININGFNLELIQMTENDVIVIGKVQSISMEENTDNAV